jgi:broad specificity phosphatase PhoE
MPSIIYIVHGTTTDNEQGIVSGHYDCELSQTGRDQAKTLHKQLRKQNIEFGTIFFSPLKRAWETARILFPNQNVYPDRRLMEINYGNLTHQSRSEIDKVRVDHILTPFKGGESYSDIEARIRSFLSDNKDIKTITIVSHQAPQLALDVIYHNRTWEDALKEDWRLLANGWKPFWLYNDIMIR